MIFQFNLSRGTPPVKVINWLVAQGPYEALQNKIKDLGEMVLILLCLQLLQPSCNIRIRRHPPITPGGEGDGAYFGPIG